MYRFHQNLIFLLTRKVSPFDFLQLGKFTIPEFFLKMNSILCRRVVVDSSSRLTKWLTNPTTHSHSNRQTFTSLYKPNQSRHFRTHYLPSTPSSPPASRFDLSQLWRSEKIRGFFASALGNKAAKLGNLVESRVGFIGSQFPKKGFEFERFSGFQSRGWYIIVPHSSPNVLQPY